MPIVGQCPVRRFSEAACGKISGDAGKQIPVPCAFQSFQIMCGDFFQQIAVFPELFQRMTAEIDRDSC